MSRLLYVFVLFPLLASAGSLWGEDEYARVQVIQPFVEWRTGPGSGYPVVHASEQGEWLTLIRRRTGWIRVRDEKGREGWVSSQDISGTLDAAGRPVELFVPDFSGFRDRRVEAGLMMGDFEGASAIAAYGGYWMTRNLAAELWLSQVLGNVSEIRMVNANLVHQIFPHWRVSPFFTLGVGHLWIDPKATLAQPEDRNSMVGHAGIGIRAYVTDRYFIRAEVKDYKVFTDRQTNEEATEWKIGLSIFF